MRNSKGYLSGTFAMFIAIGFANNLLAGTINKNLTIEGTIKPPELICDANLGSGNHTWDINQTESGQLKAALDEKTDSLTVSCNRMALISISASDNKKASSLINNEHSFGMGKLGELMIGSYVIEISDGLVDAKSSNFSYLSEKKDKINLPNNEGNKLQFDEKGKKFNAKLTIKPELNAEVIPLANEKNITLDGSATLKITYGL